MRQKVLICWILALSLVLCLFACRSADEPLQGDVTVNGEVVSSSNADSAPETTTAAAPLPENVYTEYDGFYITLNSSSKDYISVTWHNDTDNENISFGEYYRIEIYKNGTWEGVPGKGETEITVRDIAYVLPSAGGQKKMTFSVSHLDMSEPGTYRVRCDFYTGGNTYNTWAEFEVTE